MERLALINEKTSIDDILDALKGCTPAELKVKKAIFTAPHVKIASKKGVLKLIIDKRKNKLISQGDIRLVSQLPSLITAFAILIFYIIPRSIISDYYAAAIGIFFMVFFMLINYVVVKLIVKKNLEQIKIIIHKILKDKGIIE